MKTKEEITQRVVELAQEATWVKTGTVIAPETDLNYDLGFDSLDLTELDMKLETEFDISICNLDLDDHKISTYVDVIYKLLEDAV